MSAAGPILGELSTVKLALLARRVRGEAQSVLQADPIAVVGMACRVPGGCDTPQQLWQFVARAGDAIGEVPADRWDAQAWYDPDPATPGKASTTRGGFLSRIDTFDAGYFGILPREAERMDPQQRLFLEVAVEAFDDAGLPRDRLRGSRTGVYVASYHNDYAALQYADLESIDARMLTGTLHSVLANRLSFLLDLRGPSLAIDTACSSSLVAIHLACQSLRSGESDVALAGGVSLMVTPDLMVSLSKVGFMAPDGRCKPFDVSADGFGRGEGCGLVVLKRLSDAIADGDRVHAVLRGSAVNQDGHSTLLTAPNGLAQRAMIAAAFAAAQLDPARVGYVEAHGTGTALGDPIEVEALAETIGRAAPDAGPCFFGSVKANLGHLEAAAGVVGLIKAVLALRHEAVPPQAQFSRLSPHITLAGTRLAISTTLTPWPAGNAPRCAAVSSFGVGGTNAHVILEEAPRLPAVPTPHDGAPRLLPISAQSGEALNALARRWIDFLATSADREADIAYCASERRSHLDVRMAVVGRSKTEWRARLVAALASPAQAARRAPAAAPRVAFVMSGQGPQWFAMGRELLAAEPVFRDTVLQCDALLRRLAGWSLLDELGRAEDASRLGDTEVAQPALFALQAALAALWASWGVRPDGVVGHSVGEIAALHIAGMLPLAEALRVVWHRARAMHQASGLGRMAAVALTAAEADELVRPFGNRLSLAAVNAPRSVVLSGDGAALDSALATLAQREVDYRLLPVQYAFHSAQMALAAQRVATELAGLRCADAAQVAFYSTVTGGALPATAVDAGYVGRNVREPVRFADAITAMAEDGFDTFLEIGPHPVLGAAIVECGDAAGRSLLTLASLRRQRPERETLLTACAGLYAAGVTPEWSVIEPEPGAMVPLPAYPWQHKAYWIRRRPTLPRAATAGAHPLLGSRLPAAGIDARIFEGDARGAAAWLKDHRIFGRLLMPGAAVMETLLAAARATHGDAFELTGFVLNRPLVCDESDPGRTHWQTVQTGAAGELTLFEAASGADGGTTWLPIASARASAAGALPDLVPSSPTESLGLDDVQARFSALGVEFGPAFRCLEAVRCGDGVAEGWVQLPSALAGEAVRHLLHPVVLDAGLQLCSLAAPASPDDGRPADVMLPLGADRFAVLGAAPARLFVRARIREALPGRSICADLRFAVDDGPHAPPLAVVEGMRFARAEAGAIGPAAVAEESLYTVRWQRTAALPASRAAAPGGRWLVLADRCGIGDAIARAISDAGAQAICVLAGDPMPDSRGALRSLDPAQPEAFVRLLEEVDGTTLAGVIHLWSLDLPPWLGVANPDPAQDDLRCTGSLLHLAQALATRGPAPLWIVSRGAQVVTGDEPPEALQPRAAGAWGLASVVAVEHPDLQVRCVDLDPHDNVRTAADRLLGELQRVPPADATGPRNVAMRAGEPWTPRLQRRVASARGSVTHAQQLVVLQPGTLDGAALRPLARAPLRAGDVRLDVHAAGLNFRDVLLTLGMYPGVGIPLGAECAGVVTEVAPDETRWRVGDRVFGYAPASLATEAVVRADFLAAVPATLTVRDAAALPVAFFTAMYGLVHRAGLKRGERVLIHAAAGGVGLAAVQVARRIGAEVFATAGSDRKRAMLRAMGVAQVFDSRAVSFADDVLSATGGAGVDVVLNSLAGDFIAASLRCLGQGGRFVELGKRDILSPQTMAARRPDVAYHPFDLGTEAQARPGLLQPMFDELVAALADGSLQPLPVQSWPLSQSQAAMRQMAQARHTGKIVLLPDAMARAGPVRDDASYLITGGLGALGLATARWLVASGARHLVLTGRSAPRLAARQTIDEWQELGAHVRVEAMDVADASGMRALLADIARTMPPLRGVVHAAGTLHDGVLSQQRWDEARAVLRGKAHGAWVLHDCTRHVPLDFFVLYSAAGQWLGAAGQGLYAAANAELDALAQARRLAGLPALSVAWGAWAGAGMAADAAANGRDVWAERGLLKITPDQGFAALRTLLEDGVACAAVLPIDWARFAASLPAGADASFFGAVLRSAPAAAPVTSRAATLRALPVGRRRGALADQLAAQALHVLGLAPGTPLDARASLKEIGLDSLMAVELRNALAHAFDQTLPVTLLFDYPTLDALASHLARLFDLDTEVRPSPVVHDAAAAEVRVSIQALSDAEAEAQLLAELDAAPPGAPR